MKIYISHSSIYDFHSELYQPIKNSALTEKHEIAFPHDNSLNQFPSKEYIENADLVFAEVSYPSTGVGIELGWADSFKTKIVCIHKTESKYSSSLEVVCSTFIQYEDKDDLIKKLEAIIS